MAVVNRVKSGLGSKLSISTTAYSGTKDSTGYAAATYANITLEGFSAPGESYATLEWADLFTGNTTYIKGKKAYPTIDVTIADIPTDTARTAFDLGLADLTGEMAFKAEMTTDGTTSGTIRYFTALVMSKKFGDVNLDGVRTITYTLQVSSPVVTVAAA